MVWYLFLMEEIRMFSSTVFFFSPYLQISTWISPSHQGWVSDKNVWSATLFHLSRGDYCKTWYIMYKIPYLLQSSGKQSIQPAWVFFIFQYIYSIFFYHFSQKNIWIFPCFHSESFRCVCNFFWVPHLELFMWCKSYLLIACCKYTFSFYSPSIFCNFIILETTCQQAGIHRTKNAGILRPADKASV